MKWWSILSKCVAPMCKCVAASKLPAGCVDGVVVQATEVLSSKAKNALAALRKKIALEKLLLDINCKSTLHFLSPSNLHMWL